MFFLKYFLRRLTLFFVPVNKDMLKNKLPVSFAYGLDRGTPIDRLYIEDFLEKYKKDISGACLEIADNVYTLKFGDSRVTKSDILDINTDNKRATIIADLRNMPSVVGESYDCILLTQVFQFIDDYQSAVKELYRILKPGGVLLVTLPFFSRVDCVAGTQGDFWRFTQASARFIFGTIFGNKNVSVASLGNFSAGLAFWSGLAQEDIHVADLKKHDENFPCIITVRAIKK